MSAAVGAAVAEAAARLDLAQTPLSLPGSRLYFLRDRGVSGGLSLHSAEYERDLADTTLLSDIVVRGADGAELPITAVHLHAIEFGGRVTATFAGPRAISIGGDGSAWQLLARASTPFAADGTRQTDLLWAGAIRVRADDGALSPQGSTVTYTGAGQVTVAASADVAPGGHATHLAEAERTWAQWMARCPQVREDLAGMTAHCWWALGNNTVPLLSHPGHAVVPDLVGYAALWQWDAYFIARGLRHGDAELAREQLSLALAHPTGTGQLPDVVHDTGVLASSEDLPPGDLASLRALGSPVANPDAPIPLTKPPLTAWAIDAVAGEGTDADRTWRDWAMSRALASQRWWFDHSDVDDDGMPEYLHPYSSGLDDSPVFDRTVPLASPDLGAYLVLQDLLLARWAHQRRNAEIERECQERAGRTLALLLNLWDGERFVPHGRDGAVSTRAVVELLPLLTGLLPGAVAHRLVADLEDTRRYAAPFGVPTVAQSDPAFDPEVMWRGPAWLNIEVLLAEGLWRSGFPDRARALAEHAVHAVMTAGHPYEYWNPLTGQGAPRAMRCFGWTAALFVDLAVALTGETGR